ncbi:MAG TPA: MoaD/ThiS family protein [Chloroflexota bacterium]
MPVRVEVHLHGGLLRYTSESTRGEVWREYPPGTRVADIVSGLGIPRQQPVIVGLNGQTAGLDDVLPDGARVDLVPPISGGKDL